LGAWKGEKAKLLRKGTGVIFKGGGPIGRREKWAHAAAVGRKSITSTGLHRYQKLQKKGDWGSVKNIEREKTYIGSKHNQRGEWTWGGINTHPNVK